MSLSYKKIEPLIISGKNVFSKWFGYFGLGIGVLLLLVSLQMFINIQQLLKENSLRKSGYDFISISKTITNENMGKDNRFTNADLINLKNQPGIEGVALLIPNQFRVRATAGDIIPFSTDLFLKSILQNIVSALGVFGVLVIVLALMLFSFYLQLMIAKSKDNLRLLLTLGYSPGWLASSVAKTWLPVYLLIIVVALFLTQVLHILF